MVLARKIICKDGDGCVEKKILGTTCWNLLSPKLEQLLKVLFMPVFFLVAELVNEKFRGSFTFSPCFFYVG